MNDIQHIFFGIPGNITRAPFHLVILHFLLDFSHKGDLVEFGYGHCFGQNGSAALRGGY